MIARSVIAASFVLLNGSLTHASGPGDGQLVRVNAVWMWESAKPVSPELTRGFFPLTIEMLDEPGRYALGRPNRSLPDEPLRHRPVFDDGYEPWDGVVIAAADAASPALN